MTNDLRRWPELFTEYASAEIIEQVGNTFRFRLAMHPDENGKVWSWVSERTLDPAPAGSWPAGSSRAVRVHGHRVDLLHRPDGTRMRWIQDFRMRPDAPIDTPRMTDRINANTRSRWPSSRKDRGRGRQDVAHDRHPARTVGRPFGPHVSRDRPRPTAAAAATSAPCCRRPPSGPPPASSARLRSSPARW